MKNVIVTGVSSFIGAHLSKILSSLNYKVIGTLTKNVEKYKGVKENRLKILLNSNIQLDFMDLRDLKSVNRIINRYEPMYWFHHAAWTKDYTLNKFNLPYANRINLNSLELIYKSLSKINCLGIILTGSNAEYGNTDFASLEEDICNPLSKYGLSKLILTKRSFQLSHEYNIPTRVGRVFLPYGTYDNPNKLIPLVTSCLLKGEKIELTSCKQKRDLLGIDEVITLFIHLIKDLERDKTFDVINVCNGSPVLMRAFLLKLCNLLGCDKKLLQFGRIPMRSNEPMVSYGSSKKAKNLFVWKPNTVDNSLRSYVDMIMKFNENGLF